MVKNDGSSVLDVLDRNDGLFHPHLTYWDSQRGELYVSQLDVQMRPTIRYKGTTRTPGALINVYSLPTRRSQQEAESTPGDLQSENVARLTLPSLVGRRHVNCSMTSTVGPRDAWKSTSDTSRKELQAGHDLEKKFAKIWPWELPQLVFNLRSLGHAL